MTIHDNGTRGAGGVEEKQVEDNRGNGTTRTTTFAFPAETNRGGSGRIRKNSGRRLSDSDQDPFNVHQNHLCLLAQNGDLEGLRRLLQQDASGSEGGVKVDPSLINPRYGHLSALELAAQAGHVKATELLFDFIIKSKPPVDEAKLIRWMMTAIDFGWLALIDAILDSKLLHVDTIIRPDYGFTILMHAAKKGRVSKKQLLGVT